MGWVGQQEGSGRMARCGRVRVGGEDSACERVRGRAWMEREGPEGVGVT